MANPELKQTIHWIGDFLKKRLKYENEDLPYYVAIAAAFILFVLALNGFIELTEGLAEFELRPYDEFISGIIHSMRNETLTPLMILTTDLGGRISYIVLTIAVGILFWVHFKSPKLALQTASVLILASVTNVLLKRVIDRARPGVEHLVEVSSESFPSGHAMSAMAFYGFLIYLVLRYRMALWLKVSLTLFLVLLILAIGFSRIYLGVHYPSDVAAGFMGGLIWATFCIILFNVIELWRIKKERNSRTTNI